LDSQSEESPLGAATDPVLDPDERRERGRLRREVAALRATPAPRRARFRWASRAAAVLLVLGCVGVPASGLAAWTHNQLADTHRFLATVSPAIEDPFMQSALANRITTDSITATAPCARCGTGMPAPAGRAAKRFCGDACRKRQATGRSKVMIRPSTAPGPIRPLTSA
jgi:hypothetical protein